MTRRIIQALSLTLAIGLPMSFGLFIFSDFIVELLFKVEDAAQLLCYLAPAGVFLWLSQLTNGILQGMGLVVQASLTTLFTCLIRLGSLFLLTQDPAFYPQGICFSFALSFVLSCCLNLCLIRRHCGYGWIPAVKDSLRTASRKRPGYSRYKKGAAGIRTEVSSKPRSFSVSLKSVLKMGLTLRFSKQVLEKLFLNK